MKPTRRWILKFRANGNQDTPKVFEIRNEAMTAAQKRLLAKWKQTKGSIWSVHYSITKA